MSFLVVYLTEAVGMSLIAAGLALTVANIGGIVGRIGWGAVVDHGVAPRIMLGLIGIVAGACSFATAGFVTQWPTLGVLAVCALFGATAIGWNGVQLSERSRATRRVAKRAPSPERPDSLRLPAWSSDRLPLRCWRR